ncbi:MAG: hypothetical protein J6V24_03790, partial [Clostridia bacterium]|nr:hypothetical protein [Clostridia bacterium]
PGAGIWIYRQSPISSLSGTVHMLIPRFGSPDAGGELFNGLSWVWNTAMHDAPPLSFGLEGFLDE